MEEARGEGWAKSVYRRGALHGVTRKFGPAANRRDNLRLVAFFHCGRGKGIVWKGLVGGAFLVGGPMDEGGKLSGDEGTIIYIYPDLSTAICGSFREDHLVQGRMARIVRVDFENHIAVPRVALEADESEVIIVRDVSTAFRLSRFPLQEEPWESHHVRVARSVPVPICDLDILTWTSVIRTFVTYINRTIVITFT